MSSDKIYFQLYNPTGMINQVMSMELAVGLAHETKRETIIHYVSNNGDNLYNFRTVPIFTPSRWYNPQRKSFTNEDQFPHLSDILEWDDLNITLINEKIDSFEDEHLVVPDLMNNYYFSKEKDISDNELNFAETRSRLEFNDNSNIHLKLTLGWYSRFFYNRDKDLDRTLNNIKFKQEYYDFAAMVAASLGNFQAGHIRLSDHLRMFETTQAMFEYNLLRLEKNNLPIVISTCEPGHKMIQDNKHKFILLDEYIVNNFYKEFQDLKFKDEIVFGLICNLVLQHSKYFIGTSGSTYTGYIQRKRNQNGLVENWEFWDNPLNTSYGPFSWNNYSLDNGRKMWWREWRESKLNL
jgi:hypothetical protein